ncbi:MAG TPA: serine/threonine-protein kinase [Woeseiaceae bacterium]|nr:serine/threonine-protein kinase [Woeseiaceae bacterium]
MDSPSDAHGQRIGPWRIVRLLGSGGMGVVYLAERADDSFRQQVAIKLVRNRLVDPETEQRLVGERRILASLNHPNIARLLDGGTTAEGTPYLVMEYIDGVPIDHYCDSRRLTVDERLQLFRAICAAVHYAHQNLVVHRDIKPTNILVTRDGTPKLLDFGIAKPLDGFGAATGGLTQQGILMMTPENAAPEQVLEEPVTTATDTYALGILLYRLLSGHPPYRLSGDHKDVADSICRGQPELPSAMVRVAWREPETRGRAFGNLTPEIISRYRGTTTDKLARRLKGDLDNIVMTALRKEPERRYRSASEFSEDLRLHQASLPVVARPDTWRYRTGKFLRRHVAGAAMSAMLVGLLVAFGIVMGVQNRRIAEERDTAMEVSRFLERIFTAPDPGNARGLDVTAKEILARGAERISAELSARPVIQATLMETIGRVYFNLGQYEPAIDMLEESLRIRLAEFGEGHAQVAAVKNELGLALTRTADYARARELLESALAQNRRDEGERGPSVAKSLYNLSELAMATGDLERSRALAAESLGIFESYGDDRYPREIAEGKSGLARILRARNELAAAEELYREAIAVTREHFGSDHPHIAYFLQNLAVVLRARGELDAAEAMFEESIAVTRRVLGEEHSLVAGSLVMLGSLRRDRGDFEAAEAAYEEALAIHTKARGPDHPFVAYDMTSLAMLRYDQGRLAEAEALLRQAIAIFESSVGPDHQYVASALTELGVVLTDRGAPGEALPLLERARDIRASDYAPEDPLMAATVAAYGHALARLGRFEDAEQAMLASVPHLVETGVRPDRRARRVLAWTADLYEAWSRPEDAVRYRDRLAAANAGTGG